MSSALSSGVTGLQAHQKMLDVAGNNLANVNTTAFKASRIDFAELLSETIKEASQATGQVGGTNPQQMGSGVTVSGITPNMTQGSIVDTGNSLDVAIEGEGYFVVNDGEQDLYTRAGEFAVDEESMLVDPATGYRVQRIGTAGELDGFQIPGDTNMRIPYDVAMPAKSTSEITVSGNLSSDASSTPTAQVLTSSVSYTYGGGTEAASTTEIDQLDQFSGGSGTDGQLGSGQSGTITIAGYDPDGTVLSDGLTFSVSDDTTIGDLIDHLNNNVLSGATASFVSGQIRITDNETGYSRSDITMTYSGDGSLETPAYFEIAAVGGEEVKDVSIAVYDSQGGEHVLSAAFVRTETANEWDLVLTSITGNVHEIALESRRINGITFDAGTGAYAGLSGSGASQFTATFANDTAHPQELEFSLGTVGKFDGLTQFAGDSTAVVQDQDGYEAGRLSTVSVNNEGTVIGAFSNGIKKDLATLQIALFQNAAGLESIGGGYFTPSANSGETMTTQAMSGGAGTVHGGALEKSNADVATEFVNLINAQNGYQANARTIRVANAILQELGNLIR